MGHTRGRAPRCGSPVASLSEGTARTKAAVSAGEYDRRIMWNKTARAAVGAASTGGVGRYVKYHLRK